MSVLLIYHSAPDKWLKTWPLICNKQRHDSPLSSTNVIPLTSVIYIGVSQRRTGDPTVLSDLHEIGTNASFWKYEGCLHIKSVFKVYSPCVWQTTAFLHYWLWLSLLMSSCCLLAITGFLWIISETASDSSNHFCPWLKAACQTLTLE